MPQSRVKALYLFRVRAFLRGENIGRAGRAVKRVRDVAHDCYLHTPEKLVGFGGIDARYATERIADGDEALPVRVKKADPKRRGTAAAAVVRSAAAETEEYPFAAGVYRVGDELADAISRCGAGAAESADLRQTCRGGHFYYRKLADTRVCGGGLFAQRVCDRDLNALRIHGLDEAVHGALAAVGHRDADDLT